MELGILVLLDLIFSFDVIFRQGECVHQGNVVETTESVRQSSLLAGKKQ